MTNLETIRAARPGYHIKKHGHNSRGNPSKTYTTWSSMIQRCQNPKERSYSRYGGAGITVCKRWQKFENFLADMGVKPDGLTIERIDSKKGYSPNNCKWATVMEQNRNRKNTRFFTYDGRTQTLSEWSREFKINPDTLSSRLKLGWSFSKAITAKLYER